MSVVMIFISCKKRLDGAGGVYMLLSPLLGGVV